MMHSLSDKFRPQIKIAVLYNLVEKASDAIPLPGNWSEIISRFVDSYTLFDSGVEHDLFVCTSGANLSDHSNLILKGVQFEHFEYCGQGWDIGAYQFAASKLLNYDLVFFMNSQTFVANSNWCLPFLHAYNHKSLGLYGVSSSFENSPHIRTAAFAASPLLLLKYPLRVSTREEACIFESSCCNFTQWAISSGYYVRVVMNSGVYSLSHSRNVVGAFRNGNQADMLVRDRHYLAFESANSSQKKILEDLADGKVVTNNNFTPFYLTFLLRNMRTFSMFANVVMSSVKCARLLKKFAKNTVNRRK